MLFRSVQNSIECVFFYGKPPFSGRFFLFILFVVLSHCPDRICSFLRFYFPKTITIAQKGFLHDKERMPPFAQSLIIPSSKRPIVRLIAQSVFYYNVSLILIPHSNSISISLFDRAVIFFTRLLNIIRSNSSSIFAHYNVLRFCFILLQLPNRNYIIQNRSIFSIPHRQKPIFEPPDYPVVFYIQVNIHPHSGWLLFFGHSPCSLA